MNKFIFILFIASIIGLFFFNVKLSSSFKSTLNSFNRTSVNQSINNSSTFNISQYINNFNNNNNNNKKLELVLVKQFKFRLFCNGFIISLIMAILININSIINQNKKIKKTSSVMDYVIVPRICGKHIEYSNDGNDIIGQGKFGMVRKGRYINQDVAVKNVIASDHFSDLNEAKCQFILGGHKNILSLIGYIDNGLYQPQSFVYQLMDSTLIQFLSIYKKHLMECPRSIFTIAYGIVDGLKHIHDNDFVHGDLHCGNILVNGPVIYKDLFYPRQLKICDFGFCKYLPNDFLENIKSKYIGNLPFMSPESKCRGRKEFSKEDDIYSLGILIWYLFASISGSNMNQSLIRLKNIGRLGLDLNLVPPSIAIIIISCTNEKSKRPTIDQVIEQLELNEKYLCGSTSLHYI